MISKKEYKELKAYWDYQRKIEFNREVMRDEIESAEESYHIELLDKEELFDYMWAEIDPEDYGFDNHPIYGHTRVGDF